MPPEFYCERCGRRAQFSNYIDIGGTHKLRAPEPGDPPAAYAQVKAQHAANVRAFENALAQERSVGERARHDLAAAEAVQTKLLQVLPHYREQENAFERLARNGYVGRLIESEKRRERVEKEQDLRAQESLIASARATIAQSDARIAQIGADYRRQLLAERAELAPQAARLREEVSKQAHRHGLLELRAPQAGIVKDLATHTPGTVVAPGTILMTLVPLGENLRAEVWVANADAGFVRAGQEAKLKLARLGADYLVYRGGRATVGPLVLGSAEIRALRAAADTAVYTGARREVSLRTEKIEGAVGLVDAIVVARQAA